MGIVISMIIKDTPIAEVPGISKAASTSLKGAGYTMLGDLDGVSWLELSALPATGPATGRRLQEQLSEQGMSLLDPPRTTPSATVYSETSTGKSDTQTTVTDTTPEDFLATLEQKRRDEGHQLLSLFAAATGREALMWGPSMIGFGSYHYKYASGHEGDIFQVGFSPRKANIALYGLQGNPRSAELLEKLGKHKLGKGCIWINKTADIDTSLLGELVRHAYENTAGAD